MTANLPKLSNRAQQALEILANGGGCAGGRRSPQRKDEPMKTFVRLSAWLMCATGAYAALVALGSALAR